MSWWRNSRSPGMCHVCGKQRLCGVDLGGQPGTYLSESSCHDGVWMDDDVHAEGWPEGEIFRPCPRNPDKCLQCDGAGDRSDKHPEAGDCSHCAGTGWANAEPRWPPRLNELVDAPGGAA